jgi:lysophospholipase L1-like esterase
MPALTEDSWLIRSKRVAVTALRWFLNFIIVYHLTAIVALLVTGGYEVDLFGETVSSNRFDPLLLGLIIGVSLRFGMRIGWTNSGLLSVSAIVAFALAEASLRIIEPPIAEPALLQMHRPSPTLEFELVPYSRGSGNLGESISINSFGARDQEFAKKQVGQYRIVVLGDSFTFGYGVELKDGYVKRLETLLKDRGQDVEVLGLGVGSYQTWHHIEQLKHRAPLLRPDSVIIGFFLDDMIAPVKPQPIHPHNPFEPRLAHKFTASKLWNLVRNIGNTLEFRLRYHRGQEFLRGISERKDYIAEELAAHYALETGAISDTKSQQIAGAVSEIQAWSLQTSVPVLNIYIPDASQIDEPNRQFINRKLAQEFADKGLDFLDTTPAFESHKDPRELYLFPLDAHTSPTGHALIAESIAAHPALLRLLTE